MLHLATQVHGSGFKLFERPCDVPQNAQIEFAGSGCGLQLGEEWLEVDIEFGFLFPRRLLDDRWGYAAEGLMLLFQTIAAFDCHFHPDSSFVL